MVAGGIVNGTGTVNHRGRTGGGTLPGEEIGTGWEEEARGGEETEVHNTRPNLLRRNLLSQET